MTAPCIKCAGVSHTEGVAAARIYYRCQSCGTTFVQEGERFRPSRPYNSIPASAVSLAQLLGIKQAAAELGVPYKRLWAHMNRLKKREP